MKRLFLFLTIATLMASCTIEDHSNVKTVSLSVAPNNWTRYSGDGGLNSYYSCAFNMPEITPYVYASGQVLVYADLDGALAPLPYVRHFEQSNGYTWTKTIDYEYSEGTITVFVTRSDFIQEAPGTMYFKAVISW
mgnify:CR=1 FL=1